VENNDIDLKFFERLAEFPKLGEILLQHKKITITQLGMALDEQKKLDLPVGQVLIKMGVVTKNELVEVLELQSSISKMLKDSLEEIKKLKENDKNNEPQ